MLQQDALLPSRNGGMIVEATRPARKNLSLWTPNQPNKVWHDRRPVTVFLIALTATFLICSVVFLIALRLDTPAAIGLMKLINVRCQ